MFTVPFPGVKLAQLQENLGLAAPPNTPAFFVCPRSPSPPWSLLQVPWPTAPCLLPPPSWALGGERAAGPGSTSLLPFCPPSSDSLPPSPGNGVQVTCGSPAIHHGHCPGAAPGKEEAQTDVAPVEAALWGRWLETQTGPQPETCAGTAHPSPVRACGGFCGGTEVCLLFAALLPPSPGGLIDQGPSLGFLPLTQASLTGSRPRKPTSLEVPRALGLSLSGPNSVLGLLNAQEGEGRT